jgi:ribosome biogenesis protein UTP30
MSTSPVSRDAVSSAVAALGKWMHGRSASSKPQLLLDDRDDFFILLLALRRIPSTSRTSPFFLPLPHPIFPLSDPTLAPSVFLIIDDRAPDSPPASKFLEEAKECNLPVSEVIGLSTLRTDYRPFESRRKLCGSHDLFLADKKILPLLPRLLGKSFFQKKKNPLPVDFSRVGWKHQIKRILSSTFFYIRSGTCCGIKVGRLSMEEEQVIDNVMAVIDKAVEKIPKKWGNMRSLHLKSVDSVALPIYQAVPEIGLKIEIGEQQDSDAETVINGDDEVVEEKSEKKKTKKKGGIRYMDGAALAGEELVEKDGEEEGEKENNKKRKKRSKEGTGGEANLNDAEVKVKKTKKERLGGAMEAKLKKKDNVGGKFDKLEAEVKTKKKKKRQEDGEVDEADSAKTRKKEKRGNIDKIPAVLNEIVEKMEGKEQRKGKLEAAKEVKKGKKTKMRV